MARLIRSNKHLIVQALEEAFEATNVQLGEEIQQGFSSAEYDWPNSTSRKNSQVVGSPRDVIDLGGLRNSQSFQMLNPSTASFTWDVPYALKTFLGWTGRDQKTYPPRNVPEDTLYRFPFVEVFSARVRAKLSGIR